jgi:hypothetical protein
VQIVRDDYAALAQQRGRPYMGGLIDSPFNVEIRVIVQQRVVYIGRWSGIGGPSPQSLVREEPASEQHCRGGGDLERGMVNRTGAVTAGGAAYTTARRPYSTNY